jgi:cell division septation protein DedD
LAQDDYYYEIQLTNKQLVFYFMAGAAGLILSFLAGVMVGRGVEGPGLPETRVAEERVVPEPTPAPAATAASDFSYPQRLESERPEEGLDRPAGERPAAAAPTPTPAPTPVPAPVTTTPATLPPAPAPRSAALPKALPSTASGFAVQVGAFKDRAGADGVARNLKGRGLPAYTAPGAGGLFSVRVGVYRDRADAQAVLERLRDDKFKPYIFKQ